jgi:hypothetical protein
VKKTFLETLRELEAHLFDVIELMQELSGPLTPEDREQVIGMGMRVQMTIENVAAKEEAAT